MRTETMTIHELTEAELREAGGGAAYLELGDIQGTASASSSSTKLQFACASGTF
jgi:hypothetical protein